MGNGTTFLRGHTKRAHQKATLRAPDSGPDRRQEPFGNGFRSIAWNISPGTIQKALAKLEELGLVFQPHNSKDYRFYAPFFKLWLVHQIVYPT